MALPAGRYGVTKNQLLKIKKLPMNTIKLIEELTEKFNLLGTAAFKNSTSVVTESSDLVESGAVKDIVGWGNKNLWKFGNFTGVYSNVPFSLPAGTYTFSFSSNSPVGIRLFYNENDSVVVSGESSFNIVLEQPVVKINYSCNDSIATNVQLEKGSTATAYEPYHASVEETIPQVVSDAVGWDVGNLIPMTITAMKAVNTLGTWNGNIYTFNGVTFEPHVLNNGVVDSVKINGGTSEWTPFYLSNAIALPVGNYALSSKVNIPNNMFLTYTSFGQGSALSQNQNLKYVSITTPASNTPYIGMQDITVTDFVVYPVIRNLNVNEAKCDTSAIAPTENGTTVQKSGGYAVGTHAIRNGAFITWKNAKAQGEPINDASDYTSGDVADLLTPPKLLPNNANLNNYIAEGEYFAGADTYDNCPLSNTAFRLKVLPFNNPATRCIQIIYANKIEPEVYMRTNFGGTWQSWYKFVGTEVTSASFTKEETKKATKNKF